jgi:linoleate 10R-lipoxygenase
VTPSAYFLILSQITVDEFKAAARSKLQSDGDVKKRTFGGLTRDAATGRFKDADLAKLIQDATEWRAGAFKARGSPGVMRIIELLGIEQSRSWGACSLNEFRKFIGLKRLWPSFFHGGVRSRC